MNKYEEQANKFLKDTGTEFKAVFLKHATHFEGETEERDIYLITLKRGDREYTFDFGQSLNDSGLILIHKSNKERTRHKGFNIPIKLRQAYTTATTPKLKQKARTKIRLYMEKEHFSLSGLDIQFKQPSAYDVLASLQKYEVGTLKDFCGTFGYDEDSRKAEHIYIAVCKEWDNIKMLYNNKEIEKLQEIS